MALDRHGRAVFFTKRGAAIGSVPPAPAGAAGGCRARPGSRSGGCGTGRGGSAGARADRDQLREALEGKLGARRPGGGHDPGDSGAA